jgi:predicted NBD/HSP70 family sugar kinase
MSATARPTSPAVPRLRGHQLRIADALRLLGPATRADLASATGLSRATVSGGLTALLEARLVVETGDAAPAGPAGGRPPGRVRLGPEAGLAIGVDVGRTHLRVAVADVGHQVLAERAGRLARGASASAVLDRAADLVRAALAGAGAEGLPVVGVGLGLPGPVALGSGAVAASSVLPEWVGLAAGEQLADRLGYPVLVDNDANLGALAEFLWGAGAGCDPFVYVKAATGIGAGLVLGGRLFRGTSGLAGEIGHITLDERGDVCRCGNRGCLDVVAGGPALVAALRGTHPGVKGVDQVAAMAAAGDPGARRVVADAGAHLGVAAGPLVNLVNPQRLAVGGELGRAGEVLLGPLRQALARSSLRPAAEAVEVVEARLGERSEVLGAVAAVLLEPGLPRAAVPGPG